MRLPLPIRRWRGRHSLDGLSGPTRVSVEARVATANEVLSPVTGLHAALLRWQIFSRETGGGNSAGSGLARYTFVQSGMMARELLLAVSGHTVLLPFPGFEMRFRAQDEYGDPLETVLPEGMLTRPMPPGLPCYRELTLLNGDPVRLTAVVVPSGDAAGIYRSATTADFIAIYGSEPAVVEDESPSPG